MPWSTRAVWRLETGEGKCERRAERNALVAKLASSRETTWTVMGAVGSTYFPQPPEWKWPVVKKVPAEGRDGGMELVQIETEKSVHSASWQHHWPFLLALLASFPTSSDTFFKDSYFAQILSRVAFVLFEGLDCSLRILLSLCLCKLHWNYGDLC